MQLQAGHHQDSQSGGNNSSGWNVGASIGIGQGAGISVFANANKGKGKEEGNGSRWNETVLSAGDTLNLQSGRDTSLTGAQASGKTVVANIGRNLTLQSQQDRDYYHSQQSNISAGASFTFGSMNGSASISGSRQKVDSHFVSVQQQTGLYAGQGGFDVKVGRHTQLDGAVIASTAKADKNTLDTGTLGFSNQQNQADFKVESQSFGFSSGGSLTGTLKGTLMSQGASSVLGGGNSSGHAESTTYAAVSEGAIKVRDQDQQQQDMKELSRDAEHAANGLSPIFDKEKELNRLQEAQLIGQIGAQATQIVATEMMMKANEELRRNPKYADSKEYKELNDKWGTGSDFQRAAQAATAALQGLAGGNVQAALSGAAAPYLAGVVKSLTDGNKEANVMAHALLGATLAQLKGESAAAGAAGGAAAPIVADLLLTQLYPGKKVEDLNESQKQTISALTTMAGSLAGSLAGGDSAGALTGAQTAKNEVENNFLAIPTPPPPLPGMQVPSVNVGLDGKPNWAEKIAKEVQASMSGFGEVVKNPAAFGEWVLEGFGITKPIDPNSYSSGDHKYVPRPDAADITGFDVLNESVRKHQFKEEEVFVRDGKIKWEIYMSGTLTMVNWKSIIKMEDILVRLITKQGSR